MTKEISDKKLFIPAPVPAPLLAAARDLRKNMTDAEQLLWYCLRRKQLGGFRFRRQHPFDRYVLDFYCCKAKLAVELDGGQHNDPDTRERDDQRTVFLNNNGIRVVRFWNHEVFQNQEGVLQAIYDALRQASIPSSGGKSPPP
jgi:very-short-patch-repair endonuclease